MDLGRNVSSHVFHVLIMTEVMILNTEDVPSEFKDKVTKLMLCLQKAVPLENALIEAKISPDEFDDWMSKANDDSIENNYYKQARDDILWSKNHALVTTIMELYDTRGKKASLGSWFLERMAPEDWDKALKVETTVKHEPTVLSLSEKEIREFIDQRKQIEARKQAKEVKYSEKDGETNES